MTDASWKFTTITLACGDERQVDVGIARLVDADKITELWCPTCQTHRHTRKATA